MYVERFYLTEDIPEIIKLGQQHVDRLYPDPEEVVRRPIKVEPPMIHSNPNVHGPLKATKKWYTQEKQKAMCQYAESKAEAERETIQLLAERDRIRKILPTLDPTKRKDVKRIAALNCRLNVINTYLESYQVQYGLDIKELEYGSKMKRLLNKGKQKVKKFAKKVKKTLNAHTDIVTAVASAATAVFVAVFTKLLL